MKTAIFPGSFNPWHEGHEDILIRALSVFDRVIVAQGYNLEKPKPKLLQLNYKSVEVVQFSGLLVHFLRNLKNCSPPVAIIKGLRNSSDFEYEKIQQYWNEDLGLEIPVFYIIANRSLVHLSSTAVRQIEEFR